MISIRKILYVPVCLVLTVLPALAGEEGDTEKVKETVEVKRTETRETKHPTLQFLKDNRVFLRARLDQLSTRVIKTRTTGAEMLDARFLMLKEMAENIAAARDTVDAANKQMSQRDVLTSVSQLGDLEAELTLMETLLSEQQSRLLSLEQDFLGDQETALVILMKGLEGKTSIPEAIVVTEENEVVRVGLRPEHRLSLTQGGIAQIYFEFVEPREHLIEVSFSGDGWAEVLPVKVAVDTRRNQITFLELDLGGLDKSRQYSGLQTAVWYR